MSLRKLHNQVKTNKLSVNEAINQAYKLGSKKKMLGESISSRFKDLESDLKNVGNDVKRLKMFYKELLNINSAFDLWNREQENFNKNDMTKISNGLIKIYTKCILCQL